MPTVHHFELLGRRETTYFGVIRSEPRDRFLNVYKMHNIFYISNNDYMSKEEAEQGAIEEQKEGLQLEHLTSDCLALVKD